MCRQGEIYWLPFDYSFKTKKGDQKTRPVIVVSHNYLNQRADVIVAGISKTRKALKNHNSVKIGNYLMEEGQLRDSPSAVKTANIVHTHKKNFQGYIGKINPTKLEEILEKIRDNFKIK